MKRSFWVFWIIILGLVMPAQPAEKIIRIDAALDRIVSTAAVIEK